MAAVMGMFFGIFAGAVASLTACCYPRAEDAPLSDIETRPVVLVAPVVEVRGLSTVKDWYKEVLENAEPTRQLATEEILEAFEP